MSEQLFSRRGFIALGAGAVAGISTPDFSPSRITQAQELEPVKEMPEYQTGYCYLEYGFDGQDENLQIYRKDTGKVLDHLVKNNVNAVSYVFPLFQDSWSATTVYSDPERTPRQKVIQAFIQEAHKKDLAVMIRPIIDESAIANDPTPTEAFKWRGNIQPQNVSEWFASYGNEIVSLAELAQKEGVATLSIGAELNSMEPYTYEWMTMLDRIKKVYSGELVYAMNYGGLAYNVTNPDLLRAVDRVGIDAFYPHDLAPGATKEQLIASWQSFGLPEVQAITELTGKKPFFAEIGVRSQEGSYQHPPLWKDETAKVSQDDQATFFEATCEVVLPEVSGWYTWAVGRESLHVDPQTDFTFDPTNKKAEQVIKDCNETILFGEK